MSLNTGQTQRVVAFNADTNQYINAWWSTGAYLYLYQISDCVDGQMHYGAVNVDPMMGKNLSVVIQDCWKDYTILDYTPNYTG